MKLDWEEFEEGANRSTKDRTHVTINRQRRIYFNRHALEALGNPDGVTLMYDRKKSAIGIKPSPLNRQSSFPHWIKKNGRVGQLNTATDFCRRYKINPKGTLAFTTARVDSEGVLILDLNAIRIMKKATKKPIQ